MVYVQDENTVLVDDVAAGNIVEVARNHKQVTPSELIQAIRDWFDRTRTDNATAITNLTDTHAEELAAKTEELKALETDHAEELTAKQAEIDAKSALVEALGGTELAQQLAKQAKIEAAIAAKEQAEKDLAELTKGTEAQEIAEPEQAEESK